MELSTKFDAKAIESQVKEYIDSFDLEKEIFASDKPEKIRFIEGLIKLNWFYKIWIILLKKR